MVLWVLGTSWRISDGSAAELSLKSRPPYQEGMVYRSLDAGAGKIASICRVGMGKARRALEGRRGHRDLSGSRWSREQMKLLIRARSMEACMMFVDNRW